MTQPLGFNPISANLIEASTGRMYFVPEGQHDSSQARSAWRHEENSPVPAGRLNGSRLRLDAFDRPSGTGLSASLPRHFVPGYYQPVPPGQSHSPEFDGFA